MSNQRYMMLAVSAASKEDVHQCPQEHDKGIFRRLFANYPDFWAVTGVLQHHARRRCRHEVLIGLYVLERNR